MLIFEQSRPGAVNRAQLPTVAPESCDDIPAEQRRQSPLKLPQVSELQAVRHYTRLSQRNFAIDTHFYPLGSCTMKYNPRGANQHAMLPGFTARHPYAPVKSHSQGVLAALYHLQQLLQQITGMAGCSLTPMAGAQGEFAGVAMIRAYHDCRQDSARTEILVPDAAHGTNPATAVMCGYQVREVPTDSQGDVDLGALEELLGPQTAGIMLTNPSTLGVFERKIEQIAAMVHQVGGLLYYDGANFNAILGKVKPGDMGFDVVHLNLHKTFSTPHGGGGPGAGPVVVGERLKPFLPLPMVGERYGEYHWLEETECPQSIGRLSGFMGNVGILLRAYSYARMLGREGMIRVAEYATLNANYLHSRLQQAGFESAYPDRFATHEFIITLKKLAKEQQVSAMDVAKRLLDYGFHAPTTYFPLLVAECFLIEPTETEDRETLDRFVAAMVAIKEEAITEPERLRTAPHTLPVQRLDDVKAARELDLVWRG
ncbi:glycine dehydrogenase subunit 2 [Ectothiorhodospiraceae bacterium BW-2]|nr:glycine dehydrogenase subunit 2 [Ectothiorhodospiraceae bacterium BW-2]